MRRISGWRFSRRTAGTFGRVAAAALLTTGALGAGCSVGEGPPPVTQPVPPAMENPAVVSGGTLTLTRDLTRAVMSDPSLDQVHVFDISASAADGQELVDTFEMNAGDEPGRIVEGEGGIMYVALRRSGDVARIDLATGDVSRQFICPAPRGMAFHQGTEELHIACAGGELVTTDETLAPLRQLTLNKDLRDVAIAQGKLVVSRFRAAELLVLDADGNIEHRLSPPGFEAFGGERPFVPAVGYRIHVLDDGNVAMLHQRAFVGEVPIPEKPPQDEFSGSAYGGGGFDCGQSIVHAAVTVFNPGNGTVENPPQTGGLGTLVLPVDLDVSNTGEMVAIGAGNDRLIQMRVGDTLEMDVIDSCFPGSLGEDLNVLGEPVAVRYLPGGDVLVQTRQPAALHRINPQGEVAFDEFGFEQRGTVTPVTTTNLPGPNRRHSGHALFNKAASNSSPIACASCHPEGQDDGLTWTFERIGLRRTQNLAGGLLDTLPLHWDGEFDAMHNLVDDVFVTRMGGAEMKEDRVEALQTWLHQIPTIPASEATDPAGVDRGEALYHDAEVGCATCHSGEALTNNATVDVGTGLPLQVPSLRGIGYRAPYMHTGCAQTLMDRFDGSCGGGDAHGKTSHLSENELRDLVSYLETL